MASDSKASTLPCNPQLTPCYKRELRNENKPMYFKVGTHDGTKSLQQVAGTSRDV